MEHGVHMKKQIIIIMEEGQFFLRLKHLDFFPVVVGSEPGPGVIVGEY